MTSKVTQCPDCKTSFRVTEAQLAIASGAVRCGSCLHIFNANEHWLEQPPTLDDEPELDSLLEQHATELDEIFSDENDNPLMGDTIQQKSLRNIFEEDDDFKIDDDLEIEDDLDLSEAKEVDEEEQSRVEESLLAELDEAEDELLFNDTIQQEAISLIEKHDDETLLDELDSYGDEPATEDKPDDDELIFDDNDNASGDSFKDTQTGLIIDSGMISADDLNLVDGDTGKQQLSDSFLDIDSWAKDSTVFNDQDKGDESSIGDNDNWAEKLLEDDTTEDTDALDEPGFDDLLDDVPEEPMVGHLDPELLNILDDNSAAMPEDEFILGDEPMLAGERIGTENSSLLANIEPEPVEMSWQAQADNKRNTLWVVAAALAILGLTGQYLFFNFDELSRNPEYRPSLSMLCSTIGCEIPGMDDVSLIRSTNLMVRSSPDQKDTLAVDVIITNRAKFEQNFPTLELIFTNIEGQVVAGRHFTPTQYLAGELTGQKLMPIMQPVHISLEIVDPGEQAVNYQLNLFPNQADRPPGAK